MATKSRGGGVKALVAGPLRKTFFLGFPKTYVFYSLNIYLGVYKVQLKIPFAVGRTGKEIGKKRFIEGK